MPNHPFIRVVMNRQLQLLKKLAVLFSVSLLLCFTGIKAQTLNVGDLAVIGLNGPTDEVHLVTLVDIPAGTVINITDRGWDNSTNAFTILNPTNTGDGIVTWTLSSAIPAGTVLELFLGGSDDDTELTNLTTLTDFTGDITITGYLSADAIIGTGEQILIYQGADTNPFFIFGMNNSGGTVDAANWNTSIGAALRDSQLPNGTGSQNGLINGTNAIGLPGGTNQKDNVQYTGPTTPADRDTWLARFTDLDNWSGSDADDLTNPITSASPPIVDIALPNNPPTGIAISNTSVNQSAGVNATVGTLTSTDPDTGDTFTYTLVPGSGDTDNASFKISGSTLQADNAASLAAGTYSVRIQTEDNNGGTYQEEFTITVVDDLGPTVTISSDKASLKTGETATLTFTLSEASSNFGEDDVAFTGGTLSGFAGSGTSYTATFTPSANATLTATIDVNASTFTDAAGNDNTAATQATIAIDTEAPAGYGVSIDQATITVANHTALSFTLNAAEVGADFDYTITSSGGGTSVTGNGAVASANQQVSGIDVSGLPNGTLTLSVTLTDVLGNEGNPATDNVTKTVNSPTVITTSGGATTFTEPTDGDPIPVAIDEGLTVEDPDNTTLASATVVIMGNFQSGEDVLAFVGSGSTGDIDGSYDAGTGVLTLTSSSGTATLLEWEAALRTVTYSNHSQDPNTASRTVSFVVNDGTDDSAPVTKDINVVAVNTAPSAVDDEVAVTEDTPATGNVLTNDSDAEGDGLTASLVTAPVNGTVVLNADGSFTYTPNFDYADLDSLRYQVCDNGSPSRCDTAWVYFTIEAINDAPTITAPATISADEDVQTPLTGISFSDVDAGSADVTVTFSVANGMLSATSRSGVTVGGSETGALTLVGAIADISAFIAASNLTFTTALNATADVTLTIDIDDGGNTGTDPGNSGTGDSETATTTVTLVVTAINDAPVNTVPTDQEVDQDESLVFSTANGNAVSVSDVDAGGGSMQVTLTGTNGLITLGSTTGLTFTGGSGAGDGTMTFEGTITDINAALEGLTFIPTAGYNGTASLQIITNDVGNSGSGGPQTDDDTIPITVNPINPEIISVNATTPNGVYKVGDAINITIEFDQGVLVNTPTGSPTLRLETGDIDRLATYLSSGAGTSTLHFVYTVQAGDESADLDYQSTAALVLNGARIQNASGDDAILTLPVVGGANSIAGQHDIVIDGIAPVVNSVAVPADGYYREADVLAFTVHMSEDVTVNDAGGTPYLEVTIGTAIVQAIYTDGSGTDRLTFSYTVQAEDEDLDGVVLGGDIILNGGTLRDNAGNDAVLGLNGVAPTDHVFVHSVRPSVVLSTGAALPVNAPFTVTATFSEAVTGFTLDDVTVTNGTLSDFQTNDNISYTFLVTPTTGGSVQLSVAADVAVNIANNGNDVSNTLSVQFNETITGITLEDGSFVYDGTAKSLEIEGDLPAGTSVNYTGNSRTDVGRQEVTATVSGDNYEDLVLTADLTITPAERRLDFPPLPEKTYGDGDFEAGATASSGETVLYTSSDASVAEVDADGMITINGVGTVTITATVPANGNYSNRPEVSRTLVVGKSPQTIVFAEVGEVHRDAGTLQLEVSASSGLAVSLSVDDPEVATVEGTTLQVHRLGTVRITATQSGDGNHDAAEPVTVTVRVVDPEAELPMRVSKVVSPNGDGINEYLIIEGIKDYPENKVMVFNRNGTVLYEAKGYNNGSIAFRGISTGQQPMPAGTYFYVAEIRVDGTWKYEKGWFVLRY